MTKTEAQVQLASIVTPLNIRQSSGSRKVTVQSGLERRKEAVDSLESALLNA
ncbi:MAG: hypothetical protein AB1898_26445 [Acidobacteriota bacterium]